MQITEKQKQQLIDLNDSRVNEILELGLKVGEWYKYNNCILNYKETNKGNIKAYGIIPHSGWGDNYNFCNSPEQWEKATKQEVEQVLTNEAKRRGFENVGNLSFIFVDGRNFEKGFFETDNNKFDFCEKYNKLLLDGVEIFHNGQWAEIIDEKAELKQEIKELRNKLKSLEEKL